MDVDHLPKVTRKNVLILKYYSFENYFLNPEIMSKLGVIESEDAFMRFYMINGENICIGSKVEFI